MTVPSPHPQTAKAAGQSRDCWKITVPHDHLHRFPNSLRRTLGLRNSLCRSIFPVHYVRRILSCALRLGANWVQG
jgi:hypothetical protein